MHTGVPISGKIVTRVLVTGGLGFLGSHIVASLRSAGFNVTALDLVPPSSAIQDSVIYFDLRNIERLPDLVYGHEVVIHLAGTSDTRASASDFRIDLDNSVMATWNLIQALALTKTCRRIFFTSSQHVYGASNDTVVFSESACTSPVSPYGAGKVACESIICAYANSSDVPATILRLGNIVGYRQRYGVLPEIIQQLARGAKKIPLRGGGFQRRALLHAEDLCQWLRLALQQEPSRTVDIFNVTNLDSVTIRFLAELALLELGFDPDALLAFPIGANTSSPDPGSILCDVQKALTTGWAPTMDSVAAVRRASRELWQR